MRHIVVAASLVLLCVAVPARAQEPVYMTTTPDDVTGNRAPVVVADHPNGGLCRASAPCFLPAPGADSYQDDRYERPMGYGSGAWQYYPALDIVASRVGYDDEWLYYRIDLYGTEAGGLPWKYGFEINYDDDQIGDIFVTVDNPGALTTWANSVDVFWDHDNNVGGLLPTSPEGPGANGNGYEQGVFRNGLNKAPGSPGGVNAVMARVRPDAPASVELAVRRTFMEALRGGEVARAAFRPYAGPLQLRPEAIYIHDELSARQVASPYPWLTKSNAPSVCPHAESITNGQRNALASGTDQNTGIFNPCYPTTNLATPIDNGGTVSALAEGSVGTINFYTDISVTAQAPDTAFVGDTITLRVLVQNHEVGFGEATGVFIFDSVPAPASLVSVMPSQGACSLDGVLLVCDLGALGNGAQADILVRVLATEAGALRNWAIVVSDPTERTPADDVDASTTLVLIRPDIAVTPDGGPPVERVPGGGYRSTFALHLTADGPQAVALRARPSPSDLLQVDSIRGAGALAGDSVNVARIAALPPDTTAVVDVWYTVASAPSGTAVRLAFDAILDASADSAWADIAIVRPELTTMTSVDANGNPAPGTDLTYTLALRNEGGANAEDVAILHALPGELDFRVGSALWASEEELVIEVTYSVDGDIWDYVPASSACGAEPGYDRCVRFIRWQVLAPLPPLASQPAVSAFLSARVR